MPGPLSLAVGSPLAISGGVRKDRKTAPYHNPGGVFEGFASENDKNFKIPPGSPRPAPGGAAIGPGQGLYPACHA